MAVLVGSAFVMVLMLGLVDLTIFVVARARAQTAADAAALAAAGELVPGAPPGQGSHTKGPRAEAARFAAANRARLLSCECDGGSFVDVAVSIPVRFVLIGRIAPEEVGARARAEIDFENRSGSAGTDRRR